MKRNLLALTLCFCFLGGFSQSIYHFTIIPSSPTSTDNVRAVTHVSFTSASASLVSSSIVQASNVININRCYSIGVLTMIDYRKDTLDLGLLSPGVYTLNYLGVMTNSNNSCSPPGQTFTSSLTFTVLSTPAGLTERAKQQKIIVYPSPFSDQIVIDIGGSREVDIKLFDCLGKLVFSKVKYVSGDKLDLSPLNNGLYLLQLSDNGSQKDYLRIIKN